MEFINVYGGSIWFDHWDFFFRQCKTKKEAEEFPNVVAEMCATDSEGNYDDESSQPITPLFYPEEGGLLPFLVDYGGCIYYWETKTTNPTRGRSLYRMAAGCRDIRRCPCQA